MVQIVAKVQSGSWSQKPPWRNLHLPSQLPRLLWAHQQLPIRLEHKSDLASPAPNPRREWESQTTSTVLVTSKKGAKSISLRKWLTSRECSCVEISQPITSHRLVSASPLPVRAFLPRFSLCSPSFWSLKWCFYRNRAFLAVVTCGVSVHFAGSPSRRTWMMPFLLPRPLPPPEPCTCLNGSKRFQRDFRRFTPAAPCSRTKNLPVLVALFSTSVTSPCLRSLRSPMPQKHGVYDGCVESFLMESSVGIDSSEFENDKAFATPVGKIDKSPELFADPVTKESA
jgi:hypothetical protein